MPPEIEVWKRIVLGQTAYVRFYVATPDPSVVFCVTPRSKLLGIVLEGVRIRQETAQINAQAAKLAQQRGME